jgi:hypothetical protein
MPRLNRASIGIGTIGERLKTDYREGSLRVGEMGRKRRGGEALIWSPPGGR